MTQKPFEDLTISDDFMFCKVMEYESICKEFLEMLFTIKIEKITYLSSQNTVTTNSGAKTIRLDVLVKDDAGTSYNVEMCFPIDVRVYRKTRVLPFGKTSLLHGTSGIRGGRKTAGIKPSVRTQKHHILRVCCLSYFLSYRRAFIFLLR